MSESKLQLLSTLLIFDWKECLEFVEPFLVKNHLLRAHVFTHNRVMK